MAFTEKLAYTIQCDKCNQEFIYDDVIIYWDSVEEGYGEARDSEWIRIGETEIYCPDCIDKMNLDCLFCAHHYGYHDYWDKFCEGGYEVDNDSEIIECDCTGFGLGVQE